MLFTGGTVELGGISYRAQLALERQLSIHTYVGDACVWDTRLAGATLGPRSERLVLYILVDGWLRWHDTGIVVRAPFVFWTREGAATNERTFSVGGAPYRVVQLSLVNTELAVIDEPRTELPTALASDARTVIEAIARRDVPAIGEFLDACGENRLVRSRLSHAITSPEKPVYQQIAALLDQHCMSAAALPSLKQFAHEASLSTRQLIRYLERLRDELSIGWDGWRAFAHSLRLHRALLALSTDVLSIHAIADAIGYSDEPALHAAFRNAGLPSPADIRRSHQLTIEAAQHAGFAGVVSR